MPLTIVKPGFERSDIKVLPPISTGVIYSWESPLFTPRSFLRLAVADLRKSFEPAKRMLKIRIAQRYRYSSLGLFWAFAPSIVLATVVTVGQRANVQALSAGDVPCQLYAVLGLIMMQTFIESLNSQRSLIEANKHLLVKHATLIEAAMLAGFADSIIHMLVKIPMLALVFFACSFSPAPTFLFGFLGLFAVSMLGAGLGLWLSPWDALKRDVAHAMNLLPWLLFAVTPIFVKTQTVAALSVCYRLNPLTTIFDSIRSLTYGTATTTDTMVLLAVAVVSILTVASGWLLCRIAVPHVIERSLI